MEESLSKFITAILAIIIMFIFPVYIAYEKKDDISYALAVRYTQEFVDKVRSKGYITRELYQDYAAQLLATGNTYDIELEHRYVRFDPADNTVDGKVTATRSEEIYSTEHILNFMDNNEEHKYVMNVDDNFNVKIKNTNVTLATIIYNIVTVNMSKNNVRIYVDYGGRILADKWWGNIDFFQGDEEIDYRAIFSIVKLEAYKTLKDAKNGENAIESNDKIILEETDQAIYYKLVYSTKPESVTGKVYDENSFFKDVEGDAELEVENDKYAIYKVTYGEESITTHAEFTAKYTSKYGETISKKAESPEFNIVTPKVKSYKSLDDAKLEINEILEEDIIIYFDKAVDIYYRIDLAKEARLIGIKTNVYKGGNTIYNNAGLDVVESTDDYVIYKVSYSLPTNEDRKVVSNNYAEFLFSLDGENVLTRKTANFYFLYNSIRVALKENSNNNTVNIVGHKGNEEITTTDSNTGYIAVLKENDSDDEPSDVTLSITTEYDEKYNSAVVKYTITNNSNVEKKVRLAVYAKLKFSGASTRVYTMYISKEGSNHVKVYSTNPKITFYITIHDFDNTNNSALNTVWIGIAGSNVEGNLWKNGGGTSKSASIPRLAFSWQGIEIPAGSSVERSFTVGLTK